MNRSPIIIFYFIIFLVNNISAKILYDFNKEDRFKGWSVVDDVVMGGVSSGSLALDEDGNGVFYGYVSLRNYGGFSSVRCDIKKIDISDFSFLVLKVRGDNRY